MPALALIAGLGCYAYYPSLNGVFLLDDDYAIVGNPHIREVIPLWKAFVPPPPSPDDERWRGPIVTLTLVLNYRGGKLDPLGYHGVNIAVHVLSAWILFGLVRRTLLLRALRSTFAVVSLPLALICSLIWVVHPLATEAVSYVIQRTESLMSLFYLLAFYCFVRGCRSHYRSGWYSAAVAACALGMLCKESMVTAPVLVLLFDRIYIGGRFARTWRRRWKLHLALAATWGVLAWLMWVSPHPGAVGFDLGVGPLEYAAAQCRVVTRYLWLAVWPTRLILDYGVVKPVAFSEWIAPASVLLVLVCCTAVALRYRPRLGFLGVWVFLILAPTSSVVPIVAEVGAERRMYLPLAGIVVLLVVLAWLAWRRVLDRFALRASSAERVARVAAFAIVAAIVAQLAHWTIVRNRQYADAEGIWRDTIAKMPDNTRAYSNLGRTFLRAGDIDRAAEQYARAVELGAPHSSSARFNLAVLLQQQRRFDESAALYRVVLEHRPEQIQALNNLAWILATCPDDSLRDGSESVRLAELAAELSAHEDDNVIMTLAVAYAEAGNLNRAMEVSRRLGKESTKAGRTRRARQAWALLRVFETGRPYRDLGRDLPE